MRVARNDDVETAQLRIELQFLDVVQDVNGALAWFYHLGVRRVLRPVAGIDVSSDRSDRRNPAEPGNDLWPTDITGVDDGEPLLNLRAQEAMGIRDDSNPPHCLSRPGEFQGAASVACFALGPQKRPKSPLLTAYSRYSTGTTCGPGRETARRDE
jgi:hypothetical protein